MTSTGPLSTPPATPAGPPPVTVLRARTPEDLLAVVPVVLGFEPAESVVMLTFAGAHQFHARVDLPAHLEHVGDVVEMLLEPATRHLVPSVVLLVYGRRSRLATATWRALRRGCRERGIEIVDALRVEPSRYFPLVGRDPHTREVGVGYDLGAHPFLAQAVLDGRVTHRSRDDLAATLEADPCGVLTLESLIASLPSWAPIEKVPVARLREEGDWIETLLAEHLVAGTTPEDADVARLVLDLQLVPLRDAAWAVLSRPRVRAGVLLLTEVLRCTPQSLVPPVATLLAWSAWQAGDGALAWCAIDRCTEVDPHYSLANVLADCLTRATPPSAFDVDLDWRHGLSG